MKLEFACEVNIGPRPTNDDRAMILGEILDQRFLEGEAQTPAAAVVCDGCGGYAGGGTAAQTVLEVLRAGGPGIFESADALANLLEKAQRELMRKKAEVPALREMCTTVAGCLFLEKSLIVFHSGDSRIYRFDGSHLARMTVDHSVVQEMVDLGMIREDEALTHPRRNVITRCLGIECQPPEIRSSSGPIRPGEIFLLCSDGLWEALTPAAIRQILASPQSLGEKARALVRAAAENGSADNITACLCSCPGGEPAREEEPFILD